MAVGFGKRLRRALETERRDLLSRAADGRLKEITYTDRYVFSPLSALLASELVGAFGRGSDAKIVVRTRGASKSIHASPPWQVQHDWTTGRPDSGASQTTRACFGEIAHQPR